MWAGTRNKKLLCMALALFWQQHPYILFCSFLKCFFHSLINIRLVCEWLSLKLTMEHNIATSLTSNFSPAALSGKQTIQSLHYF